MPSRRLVRDPERYKTTPCRNGWNDPTNCPYGWHCQHAHCAGELRTRSSTTRTYTPPAPPPSTIQSPVTIITESLAPSSFQLSQPAVYNLPLLPPGSPPPTAIPFTPENPNETLDYLESVLATMRAGD